MNQTNIQLKNPVGMTAEALKTYATELKLDFTEDVSYSDLKAAIIEKNAELKRELPNGGKNATQANTSGKKAYFYLIKYPIYVDTDKSVSEKRLPAGLYKFDKELPRLKDSRSDAFQLFVGEIPERTLIKIAGTRGIKFDEDSDIDVEDLLQKLLNEPKYI